MLGEEEAVSRLTAELGKIFRDRFGKEPDPQVVREEAQNLVSRYGPLGALKDIWDRGND